MGKLDSLCRKLFAAAALVAWLGPVVVGQPRAAQVARQQPVSATALDHAIDLSVGYLERACGPTGKFAYSVETDSGRLSSSYNIVRHAGAIYALAMANRFKRDTKVVDVMIRAADFLRTNYVRKDARSNTLAIWAEPSSQEAALGAAGLGLVALTGVEQARPKTIPLEQLRDLARFILFLQKPDGSFTSKYSADSGPVESANSLYYPGEAILGLVALYELDHSREWLTAAGKGLAYLVKSRASVRALPPDHWVLIATAKFLPHYEQSSCPASRAELVAYAARLSTGFLREQITDARNAPFEGGFDQDGRTTPTATRLEGLLAALEFLPAEQKSLRTQIEAAVERGVAFLLRAQIVSGTFAGGMPLAAGATALLGNRIDRREVRIDYVQHALSAWLRYESVFLAKERKRAAQ